MEDIQYLNKSFWKMIRPINLLMVILILILLRFAEIKTCGATSLSVFSFCVFVFGMVCLTLSTYLINDIYDRQIDFINKPESTNKVSAKQALIYYWATLVCAFLSAGYVSFLIYEYQNILLFVLLSLLLWLYSYKLKCTPLLGNIVVSFFIALLPVAYFLAVGIPCIHFVYNISPMIVFAFSINLSRELIKDIEDIAGDKTMDCKSTAVAIGTKTTLSFAIFVLSVAYIYYIAQQLNSISLSWKFITLFTLFNLCLISMIANFSNANFKTTSSLLKILMAAGMLSFLL
jgi:4-hydroxybenzoate polyprenyltransferase